MIGVGVNVCNQPQELPRAIANRSTTLSLLTGQPVEVSEAVLVLAKSMKSYFIDCNYTVEQAMEWYSDSLVIKGRKIRVSDTGPKASSEPIEGYCEGIDASGRLLVNTPCGQQAIVSGRVSVID